ncbi:LysE family translocator [Wenyingzhuangia sp. IMCC45467]
MDFNLIKNAAFLGFFLAFMIGPVFFKLIQTSIAKGAKYALAFDLGVILGDISFILIAYFGSRPVLKQIKNDPRLYLLGGCILIIYGLITFFGNSKNEENKNQDTVINIKTTNQYFKLFLNGFFLNFINVGVLAFWLGLIIVIGPVLKMDATAIFSFFSIILFSYFITDVAKILLAKQLKHKLTPRVVLQLKKVMGIILILFGIFMMLKNYMPKNKVDFNRYIQSSTLHNSHLFYAKPILFF